MAEEEVAEVETQEETQETQTEAEVEVEPKETEVEQSTDIPVRSNASYIIERQKRTIEKLRTQTEEQEKDPLMERLDRLEQLALGQVDDKELNSLFDKYPDARKYEGKIKAYMGHDAYKAASPEVIYRHLSYDDVRSKTKSKRAVADLEAKQTRSAGSSVRETRSKGEKTAEDIKNMSAAEFKEFEREQRRLARA